MQRVKRGDLGGGFGFGEQTALRASPARPPVSWMLSKTVSTR
jgi:hypothetical protein